MCIYSQYIFTALPQKNESLFGIVYLLKASYDRTYRSGILGVLRMPAGDLKNRLNEYNWDDGFAFPKELLNHPDCDLALALEIFYLADGSAYLDGLAKDTSLKEWKRFICSLYNDIVSGKYIKSDRRYEIPLSKVERYKLRKKQVPEIFLTDL